MQNDTQVRSPYVTVECRLTRTEYDALAATKLLAHVNDPPFES